MRRGVVRLAALALTMGLVAAACGDDDDDDTSATTGGTTAASDAATTTTAADTATTGDPPATGDASGVELAEPVSIILLVETAGESPVAIPNFADGAQLAIDQINAAGGIGGHPVEFERIATPIDPAAAETSLRQAIDADPTAIIGLVSSGQVVALAPLVGEAGIPTVYMATAPQAFLDSPETVGNEWGFIVRPRNSGLAAANVDFLVNELDHDQIALLCVNSPFGTAGCDAAEAAATAAGAEIVDRETMEQDATNLDAQALAIGNSGAEAVLTFALPNGTAAFFNAMANNGFDIPTLGGASTGIAFDSGGIQDNVNLDNIYGLDDCVLQSDDRPAVQQFVTDYTEEFGYAPNYSSALGPDAIGVILAAVAQAGSTEHQAVRDAVAALTYEGLCDPAYAADAGNGLHHRSVFYSLSPEGRVAISEISIPAPS